MKEIKVKGLFRNLSEDTITIRRVLKEKLFLVLGDQVVTTSEINAKNEITKFKDSVKRYNQLKDKLSKDELKVLFTPFVMSANLTRKQINTINTKDVYEYELYVERSWDDSGVTHKFSSIGELNNHLNHHFIGFDSDINVIDENDDVICEKYFDELMENNS